MPQDPNSVLSINTTSTGQHGIASTTSSDKWGLKSDRFHQFLSRFRTLSPLDKPVRSARFLQPVGSCRCRFRKASLRIRRAGSQIHPLGCGKIVLDVEKIFPSKWPASALSNYQALFVFSSLSTLCKARGCGRLSARASSEQAFTSSTGKFWFYRKGALVPTRLSRLATRLNTLWLMRVRGRNERIRHHGRRRRQTSSWLLCLWHAPARLSSGSAASPGRFNSLRNSLQSYSPSRGDHLRVGYYRLTLRQSALYRGVSFRLRLLRVLPSPQRARTGDGRIQQRTKPSSN